MGKNKIVHFTKSILVTLMHKNIKKTINFVLGVLKEFDFFKIIFFQSSEF